MARGRSQTRRQTGSTPAPPAVSRPSVAADWMARATPAPRAGRSRRYAAGLAAVAAIAGVAGAAWLGTPATADAASSAAPKDPGRGVGGPQNLNAYGDVFGTNVSRPPMMKLKWPFKPFTKPRVLRASFGEPRSLRMDRQGLKGYDWHAYLYTLNQVGVPAARSIHDGVDIVIPQGTKVYALQSGRAVLGGNGKYARWVRVGDFRYDHVTAKVRPGQEVIAFKTVVGVVATPDNHLHLTRSFKGRSINPLAYGGFVGYSDTAAPRLQEMNAYSPEGVPLDPRVLSGRVALTIHMDDLQSRGGSGVGVYTYGYEVRDAAGGVVAGPYTNYRADKILPAAAADRLYTPATNRNDFVHDFWYRVTLRSPSGDGFLDTTQFAPGTYTVVINAADAMGNTTSQSYPIGIVR